MPEEESISPAALEPLYAWIAQGHDLVEALRVVGNAELGQALQRWRFEDCLGHLHWDLEQIGTTGMVRITKVLTETRPNH